MSPPNHRIHPLGFGDIIPRTRAAPVDIDLHDSAAVADATIGVTANLI